MHPAVVCMLWLLPFISLADEGKPLDNFLSGLSTFEAHFVQTLMDEEGTELEKSTGILYLSYPGRFHWSYQAPYVQHIVTDGQSLWIYDEDLEQVTIKPLGESIRQTPAAVILGDENIDRHFVQIDMGNIDGYDWIELTPRNIESEYKHIRVGFDDDQLGLMIIFDNLDQVTRIDFSDPKRNTGLDQGLFTLDIPSGVDVFDERGEL